MALLRRYALYTILTAGFLCFLYSLSFPYDTAPPLNGKHRPKHKIQKNQKYPSIDWPNVPWQNPVDAITPLPTGKPQALPPIQFKFGKEDAEAKKIRETRKEEVKKQFFKCWENYKEYAWMHDEIRPISGDFSDPYGGWAATLVDSLDTLYIMGFEDEFSAAVEDIESIDFGYTYLDRINVFETNIRHLGGLLASYELSEDKKLLNKAKEVGEMLIHAFDTPNHMPVTRWWFRAAGEGKPQVADDDVLLAEIGSLTMEFTRLSQLTGDPKWFDAVTRVMRLLEEQQDKTLLPGMWPIMVNARDANFTSDNKFTLGGMADSTYEYFGKQYALLGGRDASYRKMYEKSMNTASEHALYRPSTPENSDMLMSGFIRVKDEKVDLEPCMEHLACFTGGMFALGGKMFQNDEHVQIGRKLTDTCVWGYKASPSGIMPDLSHLLKCENKTTCKWDEKAWLKDIRLRTPDSAAEKDPVKNIANFRLPSGFTSVDDRRYILRPEAIESVFVMYRITGEQQWQDAAWEMWTSIMRVTDTDLGNSALTDVSADSPPRADSMESFWMAETLKYFYLIFSDPSLISLDDWVFNTEAHPFKIPKPKA